MYTNHIFFLFWIINIFTKFHNPLHDKYLYSKNVLFFILVEEETYAKVCISNKYNISYKFIGISLYRMPLLVSNEHAM